MKIEHFTTVRDGKFFEEQVELSPEVGLRDHLFSVVIKRGVDKPATMTLQIRSGYDPAFTGRVTLRWDEMNTLANLLREMAERIGGAS